MDSGLHFRAEHPGKPATEQQPAITETNVKCCLILHHRIHYRFTAAAKHMCYLWDTSIPGYGTFRCYVFWRTHRIKITLRLGHCGGGWTQTNIITMHLRLPCGTVLFIHIILYILYNKFDIFLFFATCNHPDEF